jgi:hypothetical protein
MSEGSLKRYFMAVACKRLSAVETAFGGSNQHEYNGNRDLKAIFGPEDRASIPTRFLWLGEDAETVAVDGFLSWYDSRRNHPTRSEFRLYFNSNLVSDKAATHDVIFVALRPDNSAMLIVAQSGSTVEGQLKWLFGLEVKQEDAFVAKRFDGPGHSSLGYLQSFILDDLGIEYDPDIPIEIEDLVAKFGVTFPTTRVLSALARETTRASAKEDPDGAVMTWMEQEEALFRAIERQVVKGRLAQGFAGDVDGFLQFSLSVQNRRKSRAGYALGNHVEAVLIAHGVAFKREARTEKARGPDFLFPGEASYHDTGFAADGLRMLAVKTTCKDRWRQVLAEADRIAPKHLLTLQPNISTAQTAEMRGASLQLVVPAAVSATYTPEQRSWVMGFEGFLALVR